MRTLRPHRQSPHRAMMKKQSAAMVTKDNSTRTKNRTTVAVSIHTSAPSCHDGPAWPCTGAVPVQMPPTTGKVSALVRVMTWV